VSEIEVESGANREELIGMSRFCFLSGLETIKVYLLLELVSVGGAAIQPNLVSVPGLTPMQASGATWELLHSDYPEALFRDVKFLNSTYGWVVGQKNELPASDLLVLHTTDGGDSWQLQYSRSLGWVSIMDVVDEQTVWINGLGGLFYTRDGGAIWNESLVVGGVTGMSTVKFINHTHGWTANNYILYRTTDGGQSWQSVL